MNRYELRVYSNLITAGLKQWFSTYVKSKMVGGLQRVGDFLNFKVIVNILGTFPELSS